MGINWAFSQVSIQRAKVYSFVHIHMDKPGLLANMVITCQYEGKQATLRIQVTRSPC